MKEGSGGKGNQDENIRCPGQKASVPVNFKKHPKAQACVLVGEARGARYTIRVCCRP